MCTADMATMVHSDICSLLNSGTLGKTKKTRKTKGSYPDPSKTIENNQKNNKKKTKISASCEQPPSHLTPPGCILSRDLLVFVENI